MDTYKVMYLKLFNAVTDTIGGLQKAQQQCEALLLELEEGAETPVMDLLRENGEEDDGTGRSG